jgi:hypothetical protein
VLLDAKRVHESLAKLAAANASVFGAESHQFLLNPPLAETEVVAFEHAHSVSLPEDYRHFLTQIGNGGAGPFYGVFPLGKMDHNFGLQRWHESDGMVGILSNPFPLESEWNDLSGNPAGEEDFDAMIEQFEKRYWDSSVVDGAFPICHTGCALRIWLVVTGRQAGNLWYDERAELGGVMPLTMDDGTPLTFGAWYQAWLDRSCLLLRE